MSKLAQARQIADKYRNDAHVWGRTKQVAGGLLIADGLVGLENPLDGKKTRPGIAGSLFFVVFGLIFGGAGLFMIFGGIDTDAETTGTVTDVARNHRSGSSSTTCGLTASYVVDGKTYTAGSHGSSSSDCGKHVGSKVTVGYQSAHPEVGQIKGGSLIMWLFPFIGGLTLLFGVGLFLLRLASIVGGLLLFLSGRRQVKENPTSNGNAEAAVVEVRQEMLNLLLSGRNKVVALGNLSRNGSAQPATRSDANGSATNFNSVGLGGLLGGLANQVRDAQAAAQAAQTQQAPTSAGLPVAAPTGLPLAPLMAPPVAPPVHPAGWYPTADGLHERYWDGNVWSPEARPAQQPTLNT